jgi:glycosyltransferase involved in cell wall biosynthesis
VLITRMKILFLVHSLALGGAERVTANLANYWAEKGWQVMVATLATVENDFYRLLPAIDRIPLGVARDSEGMISAVANNVRSIWKIRGLLKNRQPDVAIGMMTTASVLLAFAGWGLPIIRVGSERTHPPMLSLGTGWECLRAFSYGKIDAVVALTESSSNWLCRHTDVKRVAVIGNPVIWPLPKNAPVQSWKKMISPNRHILLAVGRLTEEKGFLMLVDAFTRIAQIFTEWDLVIVGDGNARAELDARVQQLGLSERVILPGRVGNVGDWYSAANIFVLSSRYEGFPNTLIEAMAYGLPAVSFDCPTGPSDIIRNEVDGLLVPHMDVNALAQALARLMRDEGLRTRMALRAMEARERFAVERIAGQWEKLFGELACE